MPRVNYYMNKLAEFTRNAPNFRALVRAIVDKEVATQTAIQQNFIGFMDVYSVEGIALDRLGKIVGLERSGLDFDDKSIEAPDRVYRIAILGKILQNISLTTIKDIEEKVNTIFGDLMFLTIDDHQDMTATYNIDILEVGEDTPLLVELANKGYFTPKPSGVGVFYNVSIVTETPLHYDSNEEDGLYDVTHYDSEE